MYINYSHIILWLIIFVILVVIEVITINLVTVWFCIGSLAGLFSTFFIKDLNLQLIIFIIFSVISMLCTKRFLNKVTNFEKININTNSLIGRICLVTKDINNILNQGEVIIDNNIWPALSEDDSCIINEGNKVRVKCVRGVKLIVEKIN